MNKLTRTVFSSDILSQSARRLIFGTKGTLDARALLGRERVVTNFAIDVGGLQALRDPLELFPWCCPEQ